ncbi:MAG: hypothetical protein EZS28_008330 [Streblomastix strix]|uniref:Uncharacterized protein n=1 Tax=Streblomastix strix TaxID=222440 RepID=A0A5J4WMS8_9EUKA|nr:MAG: hypothetical protein EZS28_008330 [Streblomastix strix]
MLMQVINEINEMLKPEGNLPSITPNHLLSTKFACEIICQVISIQPLIQQVIEENYILPVLIQLVGSISLSTVSQIHTRAIRLLTEKGSDEENTTIFHRIGLSIIAPFLIHTNIDVKSDTVSLMHNILYSDKDRQNKEKELDMYTQLKDDGTLTIIGESFVINGENEQIIKDGSYVYGKIMRARDIEDNLKEILIRQLKSMVFEEKSVEKTADLIEILCGLAYGKSNIPVIASEDFIQSATVLIQSPDEYVQGSILELLLILAENGDAEIQQQVKQAVSNKGFLKGREIPHQSLEFILTALKKEIKGNLLLKKKIGLARESLQLLALHSSNNQSILDHGFLPILESFMKISGFEDKSEILILFSSLFENGDSNMREEIRSVITEELLSSMIKKQKYSILHDKIGNQGRNLGNNPASKDFYLNESVLQLIVWYKEEQKMDLITGILKQVKDNEKEMSQNRLLLNKNYFKCLRQIIQIVDEMKDPEMKVGAMILVSENLFETLYRIIERLNIEEVSETIDQLHSIVDESNDFILLNLIDWHLFEWTSFIIIECRHGGLSFDIKEKAVTLVAQISVRGLLLSLDSEINKFSIPFIKMNLDKAMHCNKHPEQKADKDVRLIFGCQEVIQEIVKVAAPQLMGKILHEQKEMKIITSELSCAIGEGNDSDDVISINIRCVQEILNNLSSLQKEQEAQQLLDEVNEDIESEGIVEETDCFLFHSDIREDIGVKQCAKELKKKLRKLKKPKQKMISDGLVVEDDGNEEESDSDESDDGQAQIQFFFGNGTGQQFVIFM